MDQKRTIIVADPDSQFRNVLRTELSYRGYTPFVATDGAEAVRLARRTPAHLVILDTALPGLGAYDACVYMRRLPRYDAVPIVLMTMTDQPRIRLAATRAGATRVLPKPFSVNDLLRELEPFVVDETDQDAVSRWRQASGATQGWPAAAEPPMKVWETAAPPTRPNGEGSYLRQGLATLDIMRGVASGKR